MSQGDTRNRLRTAYLIKKQQNQAISLRVRSRATLLWLESSRINHATCPIFPGLTKIIH